MRKPTNFKGIWDHYETSYSTIHFDTIDVLTLIKALFHVCLIFWVKEVKARFGKEFLWRVSQHSHDTLVDKCKLSIHGVAGYELCWKDGNFSTRMCVAIKIF